MGVQRVCFFTKNRFAVAVQRNRFIEGQNNRVVLHEMQARGLAEDYRAAGCVLTDKLYVGFTNSSRADEKKVQAMIDH